MDLFDRLAEQHTESNAPLAERMRPAQLSELVGQTHLLGEGKLLRRAIDVEAFLGAVAHRLSGIEPQRVRRGELLVSVHLPGLPALRAWSAGATGAVCAMAAGDSTGAALLGVLLLAVGFYAGIRVEKGQVSGTSTSSGAAGSGRAAALAARFGGGAAGASGASGAAGSVAVATYT